MNTTFLKQLETGKFDRNLKYFPESKRYEDWIMVYRANNNGSLKLYLEYLNIKYTKKHTLYQQLDGWIGIDRITKATLRYFSKSNEEWIKRIISQELNIPLAKRFLGYLLGSKDDDMAILSDLVKKDCIDAKCRLNLKAEHFEKLQV